MRASLQERFDLLEGEALLLREAASAGELQFRTLFDVMPGLGWTAAPNGSVDFYNPNWYLYTGTTFEEMKSWGWTGVVEPSLLPAMLEKWRASILAGAPFEMEFPLRRHDGHFRWFLTRVLPLRDSRGQIFGWVGINTDIDERHRAVRENEEVFSLLVRNVKDYAILMLDPEGRVTTWNQGAQNIKGYTAEEILGEHFSRFYSPEQIARGAPTRALEVAAASGRFEDEGWRTRKDGSKFWASVVVTALLSEDGRLRGFAKVTRDITSRKLQADEDQRTREAYEERDQLFALSTDLIGVAGFDGRFKRVNPSWQRTLGWTPEEFTAIPWINLVHPEDVEKTLEAGAKLFAGGELANFQNRYRCSNGEYRWLDWRCVSLVTEGLIYAIARDITDARKLHEAQGVLKQRLIEADRMVAVGTLAAGVAHEINNPLSYVISNLDMMSEDLREVSGPSPSGKMKELMEMAADARLGADRVQKIVRGLNTFSRAEEERGGVIDVKPTLDMSISMAFNEIRHRARLVKDYGAIPLVDADAARLGQVFTNLIINAAQAIPEGDAEANEIRIATSTDSSGRAAIDVEDTGPGIPEELRSRIFDPFFTTKDVGEGTGLGLSICHNIVTGMGGEISLKSVMGRGTTFRVLLPPAAVQQVAAMINVPVIAGDGRRASVLVVDDEPAVGLALRRILKDHEVTVLTSAQEALQVIAGGKHFDLIFSDLMMPQMTGMDFYRELEISSPSDAGRVVFVTGGAFTSVATAFLEEVANERIEKPFSPAAVREMVRRFL